MTGLNRLPAWQGEVLYRGIDAGGATRARREYTDGRICHWSGFSSASMSVDPARNFAGPGGVIVRICLLKTNSRSRDIQDLSAFAGEDEILLLPNFKTMVIKETTYDAEIGMNVIDLKEKAETKADVF